ncbi:hypothetical protein ACFWE3_14560 [Mycobacteriaceae bacterium NPDC060252]
MTVDDVIMLPERRPRPGQNVVGCTFFLWGDSECVVGAQAESGAEFERYAPTNKTSESVSRRRFIAVRPFLLIQANSSQRAARIAHTFDAFEASDVRYDTAKIPTHDRLSRSSKFRITHNILSIETGTRKILEIEIKDRASYFLELTQCLHIYIYGATDSSLPYLGAIIGRDAVIEWPIEAVHAGTVKPEILEKSNNWRPAIILDYNTRDKVTGNKPFSCQSESYYIGQHKEYRPPQKKRCREIPVSSVTLLG